MGQGVDIEFQVAGGHDLGREVGVHRAEVPMGTDHLGEDRGDLAVEAGDILGGQRAEPLEQVPRDGEAKRLQVLVPGGDDGGGALVAALVEQDPTPLGQDQIAVSVGRTSITSLLGRDFRAVVRGDDSRPPGDRSPGLRPIEEGTGKRRGSWIWLSGIPGGCIRPTPRALESVLAGVFPGHMMHGPPGLRGHGR